MSTIQMIAWMPGPMEMLFLAVLGLLIFGKRLPEVGKSLGKSIVEFKKGLQGVEDDIHGAVTAPPRQDVLPPPRQPETVQRTETKDETPTGSSS
jgi:sec-independent protein translocase protein TatA